jgi:putative SOS response-associated peptidase YedK
MCHDLSFTANTVEFITDILPNIFIDTQALMDFETTDHVLSMSHRKALVIINKDKIPQLKQFEWGLIADYMNTTEKVKQYRIQMANARSEKICDKQSAWYRLRQNRCLIAVTGFYEHRTIKGWKNKVPYYIKLANRTNFFLLGFYNYSPIPDMETGELKGTFTVLTREANSLMKSIHNDGANKHRMPVIMQPEEAVKWINEDLTDEVIKNIVSYEIPPEELVAYPVFTIRSTKPRPDNKTKTEEYFWENLPPLGTDETVTPLTIFG